MGRAVHEVSLVESIVELVAEEQRRQFFSRVRMIRLTVGALGHAEPDALRFCFDAVTHGTVADGARLEIQIVPGEGWCSVCHQRMQAAERFAACPVCGNGPMRLMAGDELRLAELEVE
jgi:hydrogenase nickel incorporation protein HypA/HybF